jgi:hypothetical protein
MSQYIGYLHTYSMEQSPSWEADQCLHLVKKFPAFYGIRRFFTVLTSTRHPSLSWANSFQSPLPPPTSWTSILILSSHLRLGLLTYVCQENLESAIRELLLHCYQVCHDTMLFTLFKTYLNGTDGIAGKEKMLTCDGVLKNQAHLLMYRNGGTNFNKIKRLTFQNLIVTSKQMFLRIMFQSIQFHRYSSCFEVRHVDVEDSISAQPQFHRVT